jgi:hypothetical protein
MVIFVEPKPKHPLPRRLKQSEEKEENNEV